MKFFNFILYFVFTLTRFATSWHLQGEYTLNYNQTLKSISSLTSNNIYNIYMKSTVYAKNAYVSINYNFIFILY